MAKMSLKDQLLKAGVVDKKRVKKVNKEVYKANKETRTTVNEAKLAAEAKRQQQIERDKELNRERQLVVEQKAQQAQIRQLVEMNQIIGKGELSYNFEDESTIHRVDVDALQQRQLANGLLAIARLEQRYYIVPAVVADKIAERDASVIRVRNVVEMEQEDADDPYADYKIPDDLMW
ncbi:DUF2058 domain-containing protein [Alginatibacterium sediminis]|uniref:DUF2058 domain-containing protein n=2 Tax=Alginatibacterium sediminis TaxID=2164068 RepID=A0A420E8J3_9ALTE|nr:DUF2058 domain-containing protein [Alginatibacterium sediminis]